VRTTQRQLPQNEDGVFMKMFVCNVSAKHLYMKSVCNEFIFETFFAILFENISFLTPCVHICNRPCHTCIPSLEASLRMTMLRPKHGGGTWEKEKKHLIVVDCVVVGSNAVQSV
jgi:hypothetical protein